MRRTIAARSSAEYISSTAVAVAAGSALMIAAANDRANVAELLLSSGADVDARSEDGRTALGIAQSANSNVNLIKLLEDAAHRGTKPS